MLSSWIFNFPTVRNNFLPYKINIGIVDGWNRTTYFQYRITVPTAHYVYKKTLSRKRKTSALKKKKQVQIKNFLTPLPVTKHFKRNSDIQYLNSVFCFTWVHILILNSDTQKRFYLRERAHRVWRTREDRSANGVRLKIWSRWKFGLEQQVYTSTRAYIEDEGQCFGIGHQ